MTLLNSFVCLRNSEQICMDPYNEALWSILSRPKSISMAWFQIVLQCCGLYKIGGLDLCKEHFWLKYDLSENNLATKFDFLGSVPNSATCHATLDV